MPIDGYPCTHCVSRNIDHLDDPKCDTHWSCTKWQGFREEHFPDDEKKELFEVYDWRDYEDYVL